MARELGASRGRLSWRAGAALLLACASCAGDDTSAAGTGEATDGLTSTDPINETDPSATDHGSGSGTTMANESSGASSDASESTGSESGSTTASATGSTGEDVTGEVIGLGDFDAGHHQSVAAAISADGTTVVGTGCTAPLSPFGDVMVCGQTQAFRWTIADQELDPLGWVPGFLDSGATGVSGDGETVVGMGINRYPLFAPVAAALLTYPTESRGFVWTAATGLENLGVAFTQGPSNLALGISDDGEAIVGLDSAQPLGSEAFRLIDGVYEGLGTLNDPEPFPESLAADASEDGSVVVGLSNGYVNGAGDGRAFRWEDGVIVEFAELDGWNRSEGRAVSADGRVVVGNHRRTISGFEYIAMRWEVGPAGTTLIELGDLPGGVLDGDALGVSPDGSLVVGSGATDEGMHAFIWDAEHGMRDLNTVLSAAEKFDLGGWVLSAAIDVAADNGTVVGTGINPDGDTEAWLVRLP